VTEEEIHKMREHPNVDANVRNLCLVAVEGDQWARPDERYFIFGGSKALRRAGLDQWGEELEVRKTGKGRCNEFLLN
jgi:hypothetical protein